MRPATFGRAAVTVAVLGLAACGGSVAATGAIPTATLRATSTAAAASQPTAITPPTPAATVVPTPVPTATPVPPTPSPAPTSVVMTAMTAQGTVLAAASNGRTVYTFNADVSGSGKTNCNSGCVDEWPPLTVASNAMLSAGSGVAGRVGHIVRSDGRTQVTYNGLPLYFYVGDSGPGQTHGSYPGWSVARP